MAAAVQRRSHQHIKSLQGSQPSERPVSEQPPTRSQHPALPHGAQSLGTAGSAQGEWACSHLTCPRDRSVAPCVAHPARCTAGGLGVQPRAGQRVPPPRSLPARQRGCFRMVPLAACPTAAAFPAPCPPLLGQPPPGRGAQESPPFPATEMNAIERVSPQLFPARPCKRDDCAR